ncbi:hypothetical protein [Affinirhizobium pseudoryzae]|uniref:hypothetical protein n=1 Tax=Allorhizobium pseudoryzae TaxID=379684 RepID=UPI0013EBFC2B|nr:hypothetical protein [Allorhizobium pseudoryzae]
MLPPVVALSDTALSQFNQSPYLPTPSRVQIGQPRGDAASGPLTSPAAFDSDRRDVLSLSGQLQLAQGLSSVAEAVGSVLKLARHEGETLNDYADRLAETIAALPPAERVALQRVLMQLFKGVTLRLLVDILKNPFGPEATRLSLQLETDAAAERDPVTKLVVTSYRQNDGSGGLIGPPNRPFLATNGGTPPAALAPKAAQAVPPGLTAPSQSPGLLPAAHHSDGTAALFDAEASPQALTAKPGQPGAVALVAGSSQAYQQQAAALEFVAMPGAQQQISGEIRGQNSGGPSVPVVPVRAGGVENHLTAMPMPKAEVAEPARADRTAARTLEPLPSARDDVTYDGPALARQGSQRVPAAAGSLRTATNTAVLLPSAGKPAAAMMEPVAARTIDRYASIFAGDSFADEFSFGLKATAQASPASVASPAATASSNPAQPASSALNAVLPGGVAPQGVPNEGANSTVLDAQMRAAGTSVSVQAEATGAVAIGNPSPEAAVQAPGVMAEQAVHRPDGLLPPAAMHTTMATAFVPAFVPYPIASPAAKDSGDLVRAVEAVNEDGRSGRRRQGRGREDQANENGQEEAGDEGRADDELSAADIAQTHPDRTTAASNRNQAPTAHLSGDRQGEAQDFYQRLAAW